MTQYRRDPDRISNFFDTLFQGIGHRGSSFMDIDALVHDVRTDRLLLMEFKWDGNRIPTGQALALRAVARKPDWTVWCLYRLADDRVRAYELVDDAITTLTPVEARTWLAGWWANRYVPLKAFIQQQESLSDEDWNRNVDREIADADARRDRRTA